MRTDMCIGMQMMQMDVCMDVRVCMHMGYGHVHRRVYGHVHRHVHCVDVHRHKGAKIFNGRSGTWHLH